MAHHPVDGNAKNPRLRLVGEGHTPARAGAATAAHPADPAQESLELIESMSRRIDVLARELHLDGGNNRPRAA